MTTTQGAGSPAPSRWPPGHLELSWRDDGMAVVLFVPDRGPPAHTAQFFARKIPSGGSSASHSTSGCQMSSDLAGTLDEMVAFIRSYVVLGGDELVAIVLWAAHTWVLDAFECTPYLVVQSPDKQCGKSRLLEVLIVVVRNPWFITDASCAALFRKLATSKPTLLLDETDAIFSGKSEYFEALRGILNAGNRRGSAVARCVGEGAKQKVVDFPCSGRRCSPGSTAAACRTRSATGPSRSTWRARRRPSRYAGGGNVMATG